MFLAACLLAGAASSGCSRKLSSGGSALDTFAYDILNMDRGTGYYFQTLQSAHDRSDFAYRASEDPFIADKCVDAIRRLGDANYDRLEGEVQVVLLLSDVLLEDPIVLARVQSAEALTKLALKLPVAPVPDRPERGDRYLAQLKELDAMHDEEGRRRSDTPAARQRVVQIFDDIGSYRFPKLLDTKNGLRFFPARAYVTRETDPVLRAAIDRAMVRRARAVVLVSLTDAVQESSAPVREAALKGLRVLAASEAVDAAIERIPVESSGLVRVAIADYLGAIGGPAAVKALVGLLDDDDASVRHRAHEALQRTSGRDLGRETLAWAAWAEGRPIPPPPSYASPTSSPRALASTPVPPTAPTSSPPPAPPPAIVRPPVVAVAPSPPPSGVAPAASPAYVPATPPAVAAGPYTAPPFVGPAGHVPPVPSPASRFASTPAASTPAASTPAASTPAASIPWASEASRDVPPMRASVPPAPLAPGALPAPVHRIVVDR